MGVSNGIITFPVGTDDLRQVLGINNNNVGYLCSNQHGRINPWSRYKPVVHTSLFVQNFDSTKPNYNALWYRGEGDESVCGFVIPELYSTDAAVMDQAFWVYRPPQGGALSAYRITDFVGYNHAATNILRHTYADGLTINIASTDPTQTILIRGVSNNTYNLWIQDFYTTYYITAFIYRNNDIVPIYGISAETDIANSGVAHEIKFPKNTFPTGTYQVRLALCSRRLSGDPNNSDYTLRAFPWYEGETETTSKFNMIVAAIAPFTLALQAASWGLNNTYESTLNLGSGGSRKLVTEGSVAFQFVAKSASDNPETVATSTIEIRYTSFYNTSERINLSWYDANKNPVTSITASVAGTTYYAFAQNLMNLQNGQVIIADPNVTMFLDGTLTYRYNTGVDNVVAIGQVLIYTAAGVGAIVNR